MDSLQQALAGTPTRVLATCLAAATATAALAYVGTRGLGRPLLPGFTGSSFHITGPRFAVHQEPPSPTPSYPKLEREIPPDAQPERFPHEESRRRWRKVKNMLGFLRKSSQLQLATENFDAKSQGQAIYKVVLTGGPCGGKSTSLSQLSDRLRSLGFKVYAAPEVATMLITAGFSPAGCTFEEYLSFETALIKTQMMIEDSLTAIAEASNSPAVIICDRGTMDARAYLTTEQWDLLMAENSWTNVELRDSRYNMVVHLVSAAVGAGTHYTTANNAARYETSDQAAALDEKLYQAWVGHPHLRVVDNSTDFPTKVMRVVDAICGLVGVPKPVGRMHKYLITSRPAVVPGPHEEVTIGVCYLDSKDVSDGTEVMVRRRTQHKQSTYTYCTRMPEQAGHRAVLERHITGREHEAQKRSRDPHRLEVLKHTSCFVHEQIYYELNTYVEPPHVRGVCILECETDGKFALPPWLTVDREVTSDPQYSSYMLSLKPAARTIPVPSKCAIVKPTAP